MKRRLLSILPLLLITSAIGGCGRRVVFVSESEGLVRLGNDVRGHIYFWNGSEWELSSSTVALPEGWYAGSLPDPE